MAITIHQEVSIPASPSRVFNAILDGKQFSELTGAPAEIDSAVGGRFSCFGGHISGRNVELLPGRRIVQAWRAKDWDEGLYSIVRFEMAERGSGTQLVFDHVGFPDGAEEHLAPGWQKMYWEPLQKYLG